MGNAQNGKPQLFVRAFCPDDQYGDDFAFHENASAWYLGHTSYDALENAVLNAMLVAAGGWGEVADCDRGETMAAIFEKNGYTVFQSGPDAFFIPEGLFDD